MGAAAPVGIFKIDEKNGDGVAPSLFARRLVLRRSEGGQASDDKHRGIFTRPFIGKEMDIKLYLKIQLTLR